VAISKTNYDSPSRGRDEQWKTDKEENQMFNDLAYAMGGLGGGGSQGGLGAFLPLILMFVVFYFLLIWPQQKKAKAHRQVLANLQKGDNVVTSGGLYGTITGITDTVVTMEIAEKVRIKVARNSIAGVIKNQP
jgi:preprotein translocase subunit YajC